MEPTIQKFGDGEVTMRAFNVKAQEMQTHVVTACGNGDLLFTAEDGTFFKLPSDLSDDELLEALEKYHQANIGQVTVEEVEAKKAEQVERLRKLSKKQAEQE